MRPTREELQDALDAHAGGRPKRIEILSVKHIHDDRYMDITYRDDGHTHQIGCRPHVAVRLMKQTFDKGIETRIRGVIGRQIAMYYRQRPGDISDMEIAYDEGYTCTGAFTTRDDKVRSFCITIPEYAVRDHELIRTCVDAAYMGGAL